MASALVETNRSPLRRNAPLDAPAKSAMMPWTPWLIVELVTEIDVFTVLMPSILLGPMLLPETTRPKLEEA